MSTPLEGIAAEAAAVAPVAPAAPVGFLARWFQRLREPSPRSMEELQGDDFAKGLNDMLQGRTGTDAAARSHVGEAVMDCLYALGGPGGISTASPLRRLGQAVALFFGRLVAKAKGGQPPNGGQP